VALVGKICPNGFRLTKPAIAGSSSGSAKAFYVACWKPSPKTFERAANSTSVNALSTGCSSLLKKGARSWKNRAGQRYEAHGSGPTAMVFLSPFTGTFAPPHEVSTVTDTLLESFVDEFPERLIGDKAYDSDPLDEELAAAGIEMIATH